MAHHHVAAHHVVDHGLALARDRQAQGVGLGGRHVRVPAGARIAKGLLAGLRLPALRLERLRGAAAAIGAARGEETLGVLAVDGEPLGLPVAGGGRALVPGQAQPEQRLLQGLGVLLGGARAVGVLDPQDVGAAVVPREEPVEERAAGAADVEMPGGARGKANADGSGHRASLYPGRP